MHHREQSSAVGPDETFDCDAFAEAIRPLLEELAGRQRIPGERLPAKDVYYHWKKLLKLVERPVE